MAGTRRRRESRRATRRSIRQPAVALPASGGHRRRGALCSCCAPAGATGLRRTCGPAASAATCTIPFPTIGSRPTAGASPASPCRRPSGLRGGPLAAVLPRDRRRGGRGRGGCDQRLRSRGGGSAPADALVVPVYRNEESVPHLFAAVSGIARPRPASSSACSSSTAAPTVPASAWATCCRARVSSPAAAAVAQFRLVRRDPRRTAGARRGDYFAVMAADLQEPPELVLEFFRSSAR